MWITYEFLWSWWAHALTAACACHCFTFLSSVFPQNGSKWWDMVSPGFLVQTAATSRTSLEICQSVGIQSWMIPGIRAIFSLSDPIGLSYFPIMSPIVSQFITISTIFGPLGPLGGLWRSLIGDMYWWMLIISVVLRHDSAGAACFHVWHTKIWIITGRRFQMKTVYQLSKGYGTVWVPGIFLQFQHRYTFQFQLEPWLPPTRILTFTIIYYQHMSHWDYLKLSWIHCQVTIPLGSSY